MNRIILFLGALLIPFSGFAFQGNSYVDILKNAKNEVKKDSLGKVVKIANLDSYGRQNDTSSVRPIRESDVMFKVRLWSKINLQEKINSNFISSESDFVAMIYEGVQAYFDNGAPQNGDNLQMLLERGEVIVPYNSKDDDTQPGYEKSNFPKKEPLTEGEFKISIQTREINRQNFSDGNNADIWISRVRGNPAYKDILSNPTSVREKAEELFLENQDSVFNASSYNPLNGIKVDQMVFEEDLIFDRNHSLPKWDVISITVFTPNTSPEQEGLFKVEYRQVKRYIDQKYKESKGEKGFYFNTQNSGNKSLSFTDAISKRLFNAYIVSVESVDNKDILEKFTLGNDQYNALIEAEKFRLQLLERVHNLWEY